MKAFCGMSTEPMLFIRFLAAAGSGCCGLVNAKFEQLAANRRSYTAGRHRESAPMLGSPCPGSLSAGLPRRGVPSTVQDGKHIDVILKHDKVDDIPKLLQPRGTNIFLDDPVKLRHLLDTSKNLAHTGQELLPKTNANAH